MSAKLPLGWSHEADKVMAPKPHITFRLSDTKGQWLCDIWENRGTGLLICMGRGPTIREALVTATNRYKTLFCKGVNL
jgi:hypothetical protein